MPILCFIIYRFTAVGLSSHKQFIYVHQNYKRDYGCQIQLKEIIAAFVHDASRFENHYPEAPLAVLGAENAEKENDKQYCKNGDKKSRYHIVPLTLDSL